LMKC